MRQCLVAAIALLCLSPSTAMVQDTPYAGFQEREIKSLSSEQIEGYLAGHGMGFALAAELNGYPGPKHVLELESELDLSDDQRTGMSEIFGSMESAAKTLGEELVAAERKLDATFSSRSISKESIEVMTVEIGRIEGRLRAVHLAAHLEAKALLTDDQTREYASLRGYGEHGGGSTCPHGKH